MRAAAIDIGTNSVKMAVGERTDCGVRIIAESVLITRLGDRLHESGLIQPASAQKTLAGLERLVRECRELGAARISAAATSAVRDAGNGQGFLSEAEAVTGVKVRTLSGSEEARLCRLAVLRDSAFAGCDGRLVTVDIGGGSTEISCPGRALSLDLGAVKLHERYLRSNPPGDSEVKAAASSAREALAALGAPPQDARLVGTGGTLVNAARIVRRTPVEEYVRVHGDILSSGDVENLCNRLAGMTADERSRLVGLDPERSDIILAGIIILQAVLAALGARQIAVSVRGLRHGMLYEMLEVDK